MKRYNNLIEKIAETENLYLAFWKARKGKEGRHEVIRYADNVEQNLHKMRSDILSGTAPICQYRSFLIFDPKERLISAAPFGHRVLHHALMNVCGPLLDKRQIFDSYACRTGKGTYAALERARCFYRKYQWCAKLDIRKYFDNVSHIVLKRQLAGIFKEETLLKLFYDIIDSYESSDGKGIPIGNLTSQYFANQYLCGLDHFVKEDLNVGGYIRYMDDMLVFGNDREALARQTGEIRKFLSEKLLLGLKVLDIKPTAKATQFLGYRLRRNTLLLSKRSIHRYKKKLHIYYSKFNDGLWSEAELYRHLVPLTSFVTKTRKRKSPMEVLTA